MTPTAGLVALAGERVVKAFRRLEEGGLELTPGLIRACFERLVVEADVHKVLSSIESSTAKPTATALRQLCSDTLDDRMWRWLLLHEDLGEEHIHPSKSMFPPSA
jgi:hypothetical protein